MRFLVAFTFLISLFQPQTALQAVVIDAAGLPVVGLRIDVETADGTLHQLHTDANGASAITPLEGTQFVVIRALQADGNELQIETTTLDALQLALLPDQTRTILFRVSNGVFAVDPETLFAGADTPPTAATMQAAIPNAEQLPPAESVSEQAATTTPIRDDLSELPAPLQEQTGPQHRERSISILMLIVIAAGVGAFTIWYLARKRGQQ